MRRLRALSNGLLLAALVLGFIVVVTSDDGETTGSLVLTPSAIAPAPTATQSPTAKPLGPRAPARNEQSARPSPRHPSAPPSRKPRAARPDEPSSHASRKHRSQPNGEAPTRRGGTVYLTFDDGPSRYTPAILSILRASHSTATFFELGIRQAQHPTEAAKIRAQGSNIGNHTYNHQNLTKLTPTQIRWQLDHGPHSRCVRPPYGATNQTVRRILTQEGKRQVLWTIDTRDWSRPGTTHIIKAATGSMIRPGSIVLMHDGGGNRSQSVAALPQIIATLQHHGYVIRRIPGC